MGISPGSNARCPHASADEWKWTYCIAAEFSCLRVSAARHCVCGLEHLVHAWR